MSQTGSYQTPTECESNCIAVNTLSSNQQQHEQQQLEIKQNIGKLVLVSVLLSLISIALFLTAEISKPHFHSSNSNPYPNSLMSEGILAMQNQNFPLAIAEFSELIDHHEHLASAYSNRCLAYLKLSEYDHAIADCKHAIDLNPNNQEAYLNRGISYYQLGDYTQAENNASQVISLHPSDFRAYYNRGLAIAAQGNYLNAISDYQRALISFTCNHPQHQSLLADIYNDLGLAYFQLHNLNTAVDNFSLAIHIYPQHEFAHFNRGCTCRKRGEYRSAIRDFSHTVRINPSNTNAYINRGMAYHHLGYESSALLDLQTAAIQFANQKNQMAYQRTLDLIKLVQKQIAPLTDLVV